MLELLPGTWQTLLVQDIIVRTEQWKNLREECEMNPPKGFDPAAPWNYIIAASAYGVKGSMLAEWWSHHVVIPLTKSISPTAALKIADSLDGGSAIPSGASGGHQGQSSRKRSRSRSRRGRPSPETGNKAGRKEVSDDICRLWNNREGRCASQKKCHYGCQHNVCIKCGKNHRSIDVHTDGKAKGKGKHKKGKY